ncbi:MAG: hypothetical protein AB7K09_18315 [Planctomycetota bacterium]
MLDSIPHRVKVLTAAAALVLCIGFFGARIIIGSFAGMRLSGETLAAMAQNRTQLDAWVDDGSVRVRRLSTQTMMEPAEIRQVLNMLDEVGAANDLARQRQFNERYEVIARGEVAMRVVLSGGIIGLVVQLAVTWLVMWGLILGATLAVRHVRPAGANDGAAADVH